MRLLLDTNVIVSAILFGGSPRDFVVEAITGGHRLVTSPSLLDELEELLSSKFGFSQAAARATRTELESLAEVVEPMEIPALCRDPDDNEVLAAAAAGRADAIVTGDRDLLAVETYEGIAILPPAELSHRLRSGGRGRSD